MADDAQQTTGLYTRLWAAMQEVCAALDAIEDLPDGLMALDALIEDAREFVEERANAE
jgi:hypothetical protein